MDLWDSMWGMLNMRNNNFTIHFFRKIILHISSPWPADFYSLSTSRECISDSVSGEFVMVSWEQENSPLHPTRISSYARHSCGSVQSGTIINKLCHKIVILNIKFFNMQNLLLRCCGSFQMKAKDESFRCKWSLPSCT